MNRIDNSKFLLYIEPKKERKSKTPLNDEITEIMKLAFSEAQHGVANYSSNNVSEVFRNGGWRGWHTTDCGEHSTGHDYLLKNGMITNSLCVFYLQYYRESIPKSEMEKIINLVSFYKKQDELSNY